MWQLQKSLFSSVYIIETTSFDECFLIYVITGRHYLSIRTITIWYQYRSSQVQLTQLEPPLPPIIIKGGVYDLLKIESLEGGLQNFLLERGKQLKKRVDVEMGVCHFSITLQLSHIYCVWGESKVPFITFWIFNLLIQPFKILIQVFIVLKPHIIFTFLIHYGRVQKMLTALFNFGIHRKINGQFFLHIQVRCFLVLKRF